MRSFESICGRKAIHRNYGAVQCVGTENNIKAVGDYLRADRLFGIKHDNFDLAPEI
jgi:hypothetical protein